MMAIEIEPNPWSALVSAWKRDLPAVIAGRDPRLYPRRLSGWPELSLTLSKILQVVSEHFDVSMLELCGEKRARRIARPRQIYCYLADRMTLRSTTQIGAAIGHRDHSTVIHAIKKVSTLVDALSPDFDADIAHDVAAIEARLR